MTSTPNLKVDMGILSASTVSTSALGVSLFLRCNFFPSPTHISQHLLSMDLTRQWQTYREMKVPFPYERIVDHACISTQLIFSNSCFFFWLLSHLRVVPVLLIWCKSKYSFCIMIYKVWSMFCLAFLVLSLFELIILLVCFIIAVLSVPTDTCNVSLKRCHMMQL